MLRWYRNGTTTQMAEAMEKAMNKINKTFKEIGEEMNEQLKNI